MSFTTPIALFIFNRPLLTAQLLQILSQIQPQMLLIVADGARSPAEAPLCTETRAIALENITWTCQVKTNFSEINLGNRTRFATGLNWVFQEVPEAIILEDDCHPNQSFFFFCAKLLDYYREESRIFHITGNNFLPQPQIITSSYELIKYPFAWGWASWRRAWQYYDGEIKTWPAHKISRQFRQKCDSFAEYRHWLDILDRVYRQQLNTWDVQWLYACWLHQGLTIMPKVNLVSNVGFYAQPSHQQSRYYLANLPTLEIANIEHPKMVRDNHHLDHLLFKACFAETSSRSYWQRLKIDLRTHWLIQKQKWQHRQIRS